MNLDLELLLGPLIEGAIVHAVKQPLVLGTELPTDPPVPAGDVRATVILPVDTFYRGRLVRDEDGPGIAAELHARVQAKEMTNQRYAAALNLPIEVRRACRGEHARKPIVTVGLVSDETDVQQRQPTETLARVQIGSPIYALGSDLDSVFVPVRTESVVVSFREGVLAMLPAANVGIEIGGKIHRGPTELEEGPFTLGRMNIFGRVLGFGFGRGGFLATGNVLEIVRPKAPQPAPFAGLRIRGPGLDGLIDQAHPELRVAHAGAAVDVRVERPGAISLHNVGAGSATGQGDLGRMPLDPALSTEVLDGEVHTLHVGDQQFSMISTGLPGVRRQQHKVRKVPLGESGVPSGELHGIDPLMRRGASWVHVGELLTAPGVRSLFHARQDCRVDGRSAAVNDLLPVRHEFTVEFGGSFLHLRAP